MTDSLVLYTNPRSRGRIARWMLEETGAAYQAEIIEYGPAMKRPDFLAINPMGKVPAIIHDGQLVTETAAICAYLADAFPAAGLAPPASHRNRYYRSLFFFAGSFEAAISNHTLGFKVPEDRESMIGYGSFERALDVAEQLVSQSAYIGGNDFSAADVYCGSQIGWGMHFGTIDARPAFTEYWQRLADRPAHKRAAALDDALVDDDATVGTT